MKKVGVWVLVAALFLALAVGVQAQTTCDMPCTAQTESTDCRIDQFCNTSGCCELIPCTTNEDCPFACPTTSSVFNVAAFLTVQVRHSVRNAVKIRIVMMVTAAQMMSA